MEPITIVLGGSSLALVAGVGRIVYKYGQDRKELNGTVERVKKIEHNLDEVREDVSYIRGVLDTLAQKD